jgi:hypothetical protein
LAGKGLVRIGRRKHATREPLISRAMLAAVPLAGLSSAARRDANGPVRPSSADSVTGLNFNDRK